MAILADDRRHAFDGVSVVGRAIGARTCCDTACRCRRKAQRLLGLGFHARNNKSRTSWTGVRFGVRRPGGGMDANTRRTLGCAATSTSAVRQGGSCVVGSASRWTSTSASIPGRRRRTSCRTRTSPNTPRRLRLGSPVRPAGTVAGMSGVPSLGAHSTLPTPRSQPRPWHSPLSVLVQCAGRCFLADQCRTHCCLRSEDQFFLAGEFRACGRVCNSRNRAIGSSDVAMDRDYLPDGNQRIGHRCIHRSRRIQRHRGCLWRRFGAGHPRGLRRHGPRRAERLSAVDQVDRRRGDAVICRAGKRDSRRSARCCRPAERSRACR